MQTWPRVILIAAFLVAIVAGMYGAILIYKPVIEPVLEVATPFIIAFILAFLLDPLVDKLQRIGASRNIAVVIVGLSFLIVFVLAGFYLIPRIADQASSLAKNYGSYVDQVQVQINKILHNNASLLERLHLPVTVNELVSRFSEQLAGVGRGAVSMLADILGSVLSKILWLVIIPLSTLWILRDFDYIKAKVVHLTPEKQRNRLITLSSAVGGVFGKYVRGMTLIAIVFSLLSMIILTLAGLDYGLIIGAISGLFYIVPYVGMAIVTIITGLAALVQPGHGTEYVIVLMAYMVFQNSILFDLIITPKVVGASVGVHPLVALFALALGAKMFGVIGMIAAVPVAASIQVALSQLYPRISDVVGIQEEKKPSKKTSTKSARHRHGG